MATKLVCLLISSYLLLAGDYHVVSGFTPVTYSSQSLILLLNVDDDNG